MTKLICIILIIVAAFLRMYYDKSILAKKKLSSLLNNLNNKNEYTTRKILKEEEQNIIKYSKYFIPKVKEEYSKGNINFYQLLEILDIYYTNKIDAFIDLLDEVINIDNFIEEFNNEHYNLSTNIKLNDNIHKVVEPFIKILDFYDEPNHLTSNIIEILVVNIKTKDILLEEEYKNLLHLINKKLTTSTDYLEYKYGDILLEGLLHLAIKINNEETLSIINKLDKTKLSIYHKMKILKFKVINNIELDSKEIKDYFVNRSDAFITFETLENLKRVDLIPKKYQNMQEELALAAFEEWLSFPGELGKKPKTIRVIDKMENKEKNGIFYVCAFTSNESDKEMIGITYTYPKGKTTTRSIDSAFTNFDVLKDDYKKQVKDIIKSLDKMKEELN